VRYVRRTPTSFGRAVRPASHGTPGDGAQQRLRQAKGAKQLDDSARFFVRQDGTRAYYFSVEQLCAMWHQAGFDVLRCEWPGGQPGRRTLTTLTLTLTRCEYSARKTVNLKKGLALERLFVTAKFRKRPGGLPGASLPGGESSQRPPSQQQPSQWPPSQWPPSTEDEVLGAPAAGTETHTPAAPPSDSSRGSHRPTLALPSAAPARPEASFLSEAAAPGGAAASAAEADRASAWSEAKLHVHRCLRDALGPGASAAQRSRLLDEVRGEIWQQDIKDEVEAPAACLETQDLAAAASSLSVGGKHQIC